MHAVEVGSVKHAWRDTKVEAIPFLLVALALHEDDVISPKQDSVKGLVSF